MSEKFGLNRKIGFQNTFYTKCINVIIDSIGPSIILRSIVFMNSQTVCLFWKEKSSNMDGFSFHLVFSQKIGRSL